MASTDTAEKAGKALARLVENDYAQERLSDAARNFQGAYDRATSRRASKAAEDKKLYKRVRRAVGSLNEGVSALATNRQRPKRRWPKLLLVGAGVAAAGALATNEQARSRVMSLAGGAGAGDSGGESSPSPQAA